MNWIKLEHLLLKAEPERAVTAEPQLDHTQLREQALRLAASLQNRGVRRIAVHLEDAADLAIALLGACMAHRSAGRCTPGRLPGFSPWRRRPRP